MHWIFYRNCTEIATQKQIFYFCIEFTFFILLFIKLKYLNSFLSCKQNWQSEQIVLSCWLIPFFTLNSFFTLNDTKLEKISRVVIYSSIHYANLNYKKKVEKKLNDLIKVFIYVSRLWLACRNFIKTWVY